MGAYGIWTLYIDNRQVTTTAPVSLRKVLALAGERRAKSQ
jgi:hypothetical protein